jgi:hypothetical protein
LMSTTCAMPPLASIRERTNLMVIPFVTGALILDAL